MKLAIKIISTFLFLLLGCKKESVEPSPSAFLKADINGKTVVFNVFTFMGEEAIGNGNSRWQKLRATSPKGEYPVRQIYCMIKSPNNGINKLSKNGEYDKVRIYYSENSENYAAWEGVKNSKAEFDLDSIIKTSNAWVYYKTGTFKGVVFNHTNPKDSVIIENGTFNFEPYKFY